MHACMLFFARVGSFSLKMDHTSVGLNTFLFIYVTILMSRIERTQILLSKNFVYDWVIGHFHTTSYLTE